MKELICKKCGLPFDKMPSQHTYICKPCLNIRDRRNYQKRKEANDRRPYRNVCKKTGLPYSKLYFEKEENRKKRNEKQKEYNKRADVIEKNRCRDITRKAVKKGQLIKKPCEVCGEIKVHAHHVDYNNPFDIQWLCVKHHSQVHVALSLNN